MLSWISWWFCGGFSENVLEARSDKRGCDRCLWQNLVLRIAGLLLYCILDIICVWFVEVVPNMLSYNIYPYSYGLLYWCWGNHRIASVPVMQPGPSFNIKTGLPGIGISIIKIRLSYFIMWIPILVRWHLYIEMDPLMHFSVKMMYYQHRNSYYKDKTVLWVSYRYGLHTERDFEGYG